MRQSRTSTSRAARWGQVLAALVATVGVEGMAVAAPDEREQCASSAEQAQQSRDEGKYRRAREQMLSCAREVCPGPIKSDCSKWLAELDRDAPTVVFGARDASGADVFDVKVSMDGRPVQERLDGKPVLVDSGEHTFKFESKDGAVREERVLVRAAEKARPIIATMTPTSKASGPGSGSPPSEQSGDRSDARSAKDGSLVPVIAAGGISVVALAAFAIFGISGNSAVSDLEVCKPKCPEKDVDAARSKYLMADISLGIGVVASVVAGYLFFTREKADAGRAESTPASVFRTIRLGGGPTASGGGVGSISARF